MSKDETRRKVVEEYLHAKGKDALTHVILGLGGNGIASYHEARRAAEEHSLPVEIVPVREDKELRPAADVSALMTYVRPENPLGLDEEIHRRLAAALESNARSLEAIASSQDPAAQARAARQLGEALLAVLPEQSAPHVFARALAGKGAARVSDALRRRLEPTYLPGTVLEFAIDSPGQDEAAALERADVITVALPTQALIEKAQVLKKLNLRDPVVALGTKGLFRVNGTIGYEHVANPSEYEREVFGVADATPTDGEYLVPKIVPFLLSPAQLISHIGGIPLHRTATISGANIASLMAMPGSRTKTTIASEEPGVRQLLHALYSSDAMIVAKSSDSFGLAFAGATKNIYAYLYGAALGSRYGGDVNMMAEVKAAARREYELLATEFGVSQVVLMHGDADLDVSMDYGRNREHARERARKEPALQALLDQGILDRLPNGSFIQGVPTTCIMADVLNRHGYLHKYPLLFGNHDFIHGRLTPEELVTSVYHLDDHAIALNIKRSRAQETFGPLVAAYTSGRHSHEEGEMMLQPLLSITPGAKDAHDALRYHMREMMQRSYLAGGGAQSSTFSLSDIAEGSGCSFKAVHG